MKKRATLEAIKAKRTERLAQAKKETKSLRKTYFRNAEKYVKEYRTKEKSLIAMRRQAKNHGNFFVDAEPQLAFVIRIRGY